MLPKRPEDIFNYKGEPVLDITNLHQELISISVPFKFTSEELSYLEYKNAYTYKDKYSYINPPKLQIHDIISYYGRNYIDYTIGQPVKYAGHLGIHINVKCHIPLELIIIYYFMARRECEINMIFSQDGKELRLIIYGKEASIIYKIGDKKYVSGFEFETANKKTMIARFFSEFALEKHKKMMQSQEGRLDPNTPILGEVLPHFFIYECMNPYEIYRLFKTIKKYDSKYHQSSLKSYLPFLFVSYTECENINTIYEATIYIPSRVSPQDRIKWKDKVNKYGKKFNNRQYELRSIIDSIQSDYDGIFMNILIVSRTIMEDSSIFCGDAGDIIIPKHITVHGINHLYTYVDNVFNSGVYSESDKDKLIERFDVKQADDKYQAIVDILDKITNY